MLTDSFSPSPDVSSEDAYSGLFGGLDNDLGLGLPAIKSEFMDDDDDDDESVPIKEEEDEEQEEEQSEGPAKKKSKKTKSNNSDENNKKRAPEELSFPLPQGALPPRKRAKTEEEKEQRRVERVMRNRQAAHASREKKRKHLEHLEQATEEMAKENGRLKEMLKQKSQGCEKFEQLSLLYKQSFGQICQAVEEARKSGNFTSLDQVLDRVGHMSVESVSVAPKEEEEEKKEEASNSATPPPELMSPKSDDSSNHSSPVSNFDTLASPSSSLLLTDFQGGEGEKHNEEGASVCSIYNEEDSASQSFGCVDDSMKSVFASTRSLHPAAMNDDFGLQRRVVQTQLSRRAKTVDHLMAAGLLRLLTRFLPSLRALVCLVFQQWAAVNLRALQCANMAHCQTCTLPTSEVFLSSFRSEVVV